jgi:hypothetical protein
MAEISSTRPASAAPAVPRPVVAAAEMALKLLHPMDGLLAAGESARAEVMSVREQNQAFQMVLRLTLESGREATLQASAARPLPLGSSLAVTALSASSLTAALQTGASQPLTTLDLKQFPPGTLVQARVVASQPVIQARSQQVMNQVVVDLVNVPAQGPNAVSGSTRLTLETALQLTVGSLLTAQVEGAQSLRFLPPSSRLDQLELIQQLNAQLSRQGSLDGLFKALGPLLGKSDLPEGLGLAIERIFSSVPEVSQLTTVKGLMQALANSGQFTEARLLAGQTDGLPQDLKANLLRLVAQLLPGLASTPAAIPAAYPGMIAQALPALLRDVLGPAGGQAPRQPGLSFPLPARLLQNMDSEVDLELLLKLAAAAVSRLQTHQLSSLAQSHTTAEGNLLTTWQLEVPMRHQHELVPVQMKIQSEEKSAQSERKDKGETIWRVELAFDLDPLGPLQVQAQLSQGSISGQLWAERARTASLINHELAHLRERLAASGLVVAELACRQGVPPQGPKTHVEQRWVDEKA